MNQEDQQIEQYWPLQSKDMDQYSNMWKMEQALNRETPDWSHCPAIKSPDSWFYHPAMKSPIDITLIGSAPFKWHMKCKNTEVFITSLYKIDWTIEDKQLKEQQTEEVAE